MLLPVSMNADIFLVTSMVVMFDCTFGTCVFVLPRVVHTWVCIFVLFAFVIITFIGFAFILFVGVFLVLGLLIFIVILRIFICTMLLLLFFAFDTFVLIMVLLWLLCGTFEFRFVFGLGIGIGIDLGVDMAFSFGFNGYLCGSTFVDIYRRAGMVFEVRLLGGRRQLFPPYTLYLQILPPRSFWMIREPFPSKCTAERLKRFCVLCCSLASQCRSFALVFRSWLPRDRRGTCCGRRNGRRITLIGGGRIEHVGDSSECDGNPFHEPGRSI